MNLKYLKKNLNKILSFILLSHIIIFFFFFVNGGYFDYQVPIEAREYASITSTLSFINNDNPFSVVNFPIGINAYSALYPLFISFLAKIFFIDDYKNVILVSRFFSLFAWMMFILYFFYFFKKKKLETYIILYFILFFIILSFTKISFGAWGNGIGLIFYTIGLLKAFDSQSKMNYIISSIFMTLSVFFKFYFILGFIFIFGKYYNCFYKKDYIFYTFLILTFIFSLAQLHLYFFPSYFFVSILNQINITNFENFQVFDFLLSKKFFAEIYFIIKNYIYLIILFLGNLFFIYKNNKHFFNVKLILFISFLFILIFKLWPNEGNFGTYSNNLLIPIIIIFLASSKNFLYGKKIKFLILFSVIIPLSTPILNFIYPAVLNEDEKLINHQSKEKILKHISNNNTYYIDHYLGNFSNQKIDQVNYNYFNGNTLHITENSILSFKNKIVKKIFKLEDLIVYYKKNKQVALSEINKEYSIIICTFICVNNHIGYDFLIKNDNNYVLEEKVLINNIFNQSYMVSIYKKS